MSARTLGILSKVFLIFPQPHKANARIVPQLGYDHFLSDSFKYIIHLSSYNLALYSLATDRIVE
jgi:hypothetical protein